MPLSSRNRRVLIIISVLIIGAIILRWVGKIGVEYLVTNYFHHQLSPTEDTEVVYSIGDVQLKWGERSINLTNVEIVIDHEDAQRGRSVYELNLPGFTLDLLSVGSLLWNQALAIEEIRLERPAVSIYLPDTQNTVVLRQEVGDLQQQTIRFLQQLNLQHFELNHGSFSWNIGTESIPRYQLQDVSVRMENINLTTDQMNVAGMTELALTDHVEVTLHNESVLLPDERHTLSFKKLHISSRSDLVLIDSLHLFASSLDGDFSSKFDENSVQIPSLQVKGLDFLALYLDNNLLLDTVLIGETVLHIEVSDDQSVAVVGPASNSENHGLDSIHVKRLEVIPSAILVKHSESETTNVYKVDSAALMLDQVSHAPKVDSSFSWGVENLEFQLRNYQSKLADLNYNFGFEKLNWSIVDQSFGLEGVTLYPIHDSVPEAKTQPLKYLEVPSFTITDLDFADLFFRQRLRGGSIIISQPQVGLVLPGQHSSTEKKPVNVSLVLQQFFNAFQLEQLAIENGQIELYHESGPAFFTLEDVNLLGNHWVLNEKNQSIYNFPTEVYFANAQLQLPDYRVKISNAQYANVSDILQAKQIQVQSAPTSKNGYATIDLKGIALQGVLAFLETNELTQLEIGSGTFGIKLPENSPAPKKKNTTKPQPLTIRQLKIDQLQADIEQPGTGFLSFKNAFVDIRDIQTPQSGFPLSIDVKESKVALQNLSVQNPSLSTQLDSVTLNQGNLALFNILTKSEDTTTGHFQASVPWLKISQWELPRSNDEAWKIDKITVSQPSINIAQLVKPKPKLEGESKQENSRFNLEIDTVLVEQANWSVKNQDSQWASTNTTIQGYTLKYPFSINSLAKQNISVDIQDFQQQTATTQLNVGSIKANTQQQLLKIENSQLELQTSTPTIKNLAVSANVEQILVKANNLRDWKPDQALEIAELTIDQPIISFSWDSIRQASTTDETPPKSTNKLPVSSLAINTFNLLGASVKSPENPSQPSVKLSGMNFRYQGLRWDTQTPLHPETLLVDGRWSLQLDSVSSTFGAPATGVDVYGLQLASRNSPLQWDSLLFAPRQSPEEFSSYLTHQKSWLSVGTGHSRIRGINWDKVLSTSFQIDNILVEEPRVRVYRDQRLPFPENHHPPLLHEALLNFSKPLHIDTLELSNGKVSAEVQPETGSEKGSLGFSNVEAIITNITNIEAEIQQDKLMRLDAFAQLQQAGLLKVHVDFDLDELNYPFYTEVNLGPMDLRNLNTIVEPVASVRIKSGKMREMDFKVMANDDFAYGNMDFMYRKLHLSILNKKQKDHQGVGLAIESFLANSLVLRKNNDYPFPHRQGQVFIERDKSRSIFNYWGKIAISGILTSAGVKSNRKALHERFEHKRQELEDSPVSTSTESSTNK
jgi:hypothetical protein